MYRLLNAPPRRIAPHLIEDLKKKMVFISGPRQCGKTTLALHLQRKDEVAYYNWDIDNHRKALLRNELDASKHIWIFDEIHKNRRWRNWLKGIYDGYGHPTVKPRKKIIVSGSARLELYGRGGDSLQGRYFHHHLHPFTLGELLKSPLEKDWKNIPSFDLDINIEAARNYLSELYELGGFPEPFLSSSKKEADRWRTAYSKLLVREELRSLEAFMDLDRIELLFDRLSECVGSILSINSLREDLEVSFPTLKKWVHAFEKLYGVFLIRPFGPAKIKSVKKEPKLYFWDWARVEKQGPRFENLVAVHLLRLVHWIEDLEGKNAELRYFRTANKQEVDFIILVNRKPWIAVEVKLTDEAIDPNLKYMLSHVPVPYAFQVSLQGTKDYVQKENTFIRVIPAPKFLACLP